jgi:hypothetical protein
MEDFFYFGNDLEYPKKEPRTRRFEAQFSARRSAFVRGEEPEVTWSE